MKSYLVILCVIMGLSGLLAQNPQIQVAEGIIVGKTVTFSEGTHINVTKNVDVFQGIPYAEPPERFTPALRKQPWQGVLNATSFKPSCTQDPHLYYPPSDEDCLYLNVYAPNPKLNNAAVMVWIHGGSFEIGTSMTWDFYGLPLVAVGDVILVTLNYRLGIFSQFTTRDSEAPGNLGMIDQVTALQWVNDNIEAFGGNKSRITIFGVSSGASSVSLHLLSKMSRGLFSQAIIQSGSSLASWAFVDDRERDLTNAEQLGRSMNCDVTNSSNLVSCLRAKPVNDVLRTAKPIYSSYSAMHIDGTFLEASPRDIYESGDFAHVPIIAGFGKDEGTMIPFLSLPKYTGSPTPPYINKTLFESFARSRVQMDSDLLLDTISQEYTDWSHADDPVADYFQSLVDMSGDVIFNCPIDEVLRYHAEAGDMVYTYFMTHAPTATSYAQVGDIIPFTPWVKAGHAEELMFVFGFPFIEEQKDIHGHNMTDEEKALSVKFMQFWSNFAKSGDPSKATFDAPAGVGPHSWPIYSIPELRYKELSIEMGEGRAVRARQCRFLNKYYPSLEAFGDSVDPMIREWQESYLAWQRDMASWRTQFEDYKSQPKCG